MHSPQLLSKEFEPISLGVRPTNSSALFVYCSAARWLQASTQALVIVRPASRLNEIGLQARIWLYRTVWSALRTAPQDRSLGECPSPGCPRREQRALPCSAGERRRALHDGMREPAKSDDARRSHHVGQAAGALPGAGNPGWRANQRFSAGRTSTDWPPHRPITR